MSRPATGGSFDRDPVSVLLDRGARRLLERAYASPGQWVTTRLADPTPEHVAHCGAQGINVLEPDRAGRALNAHTRWARGFVRAAYYQHQWYSNLGSGRGWRSSRRMTERRAGALKLDVGRHMPELGVIPAGRVVRAILYPGGQAAQRAADRAPGYLGNGPAAADPSRRDWLWARRPSTAARGVARVPRVGPPDPFFEPAQALVQARENIGYVLVLVGLGLGQVIKFLLEHPAVAGRPRDQHQDRNQDARDYRYQHR